MFAVYYDPGTVIAIVLVVTGLLALIPAKIAKDKGYDAVAFWLFGVIAFFVALIVALVIQPKPGASPLVYGPMRVCSFCAEPIRPAAIVCPYCGRDQATVPCPRCGQQMPAGAGVQCPSCRQRPVLAFHDGHWWTQDAGGASSYPDPVSSRWVASPTGRP